MVSYKKLWKILIDRDMKKQDLMRIANISSATVQKLNKGDNVNVDILIRICKALECNIEEIMEINFNYDED